MGFGRLDFYYAEPQAALRSTNSLRFRPRETAVSKTVFELYAIEKPTVTTVYPARIGTEV